MKNVCFLVMLGVLFIFLGDIIPVDVLPSTSMMHTHVFSDIAGDGYQVRVFVPQLGILAKSKRFDLEKSFSGPYVNQLKVNHNAKPGYYMARVTVSNDAGERKVRHRWLRVR